MDLDKSIKERRSVRAFTSKSVKWSEVMEAIDAANQAPFAGNQNNLQFIIVSEAKKIDSLAQHSQQLWINDAQYIVVVCADTKKLVRLYDEIGKTYSKQQAGAAIENLLLKLTELKLGACWIGAFAEGLVKEELNIPEDWVVEALIPIGYAKDKKQKQVKKASLENKIYWDKWGVSKKPAIYPVK